MTQVFVDTKTYRFRMKICSLCPEFLTMIKMCGKCKCIMPIKAHLAPFSCPLNRWMAIKDVKKA